MRIRELKRENAFLRQRNSVLEAQLQEKQPTEAVSDLESSRKRPRLDADTSSKAATTMPRKPPVSSDSDVHGDPMDAATLSLPSDAPPNHSSADDILRQVESIQPRRAIILLI